MSGISSSKRLESLVRHFQARTLPREVSAYNTASGVENGPFSGYHETLTRFYLRVVAAFLRAADLRADETAGDDGLWAQLGEEWGDKNAVFAYYSRRYLFSPSTRARFAPPDLRPFDF